MSSATWKEAAGAASVSSASRRHALGAAAGAAAGFALPATSATLGVNSGQQSFLQIAVALSGQAAIPALLLDASAAEFERAFGGDALVRFVRACEGLDAQALASALPDATLEAQARWLVAFLYTGEVMRDGQLQAVWYPWCLAWQAARFAKPPGVCGGPFGWWTTP
jgi:Membrane bound FAD containing D-sorbitol dehydrogenase